MAATVDSTVLDTSVDRLICAVQLSVLNPGATETITLPSNSPAVYPHYFTCATLTPSTSGDPVFHRQATNWAKGAANSGRTVTVVLDTVAGGDLVGAVVRLEFEWLAQGSGGIS